MTAAPPESRSKRRCLGLGRPRPAGSTVGWAATTTDLRGVLKAIFYLLRTGLAVALATQGVPAPGAPGCRDLLGLAERVSS